LSESDREMVKSIYVLPSCLRRQGYVGTSLASGTIVRLEVDKC